MSDLDGTCDFCGEGLPSGGDSSLRVTTLHGVWDGSCRAGRDAHFANLSTAYIRLQLNVLQRRCDADPRGLVDAKKRLYQRNRIALLKQVLADRAQDVVRPGRQ